MVRMVLATSKDGKWSCNASNDYNMTAKYLKKWDIIITYKRIMSLTTWSMIFTGPHMKTS